MPPVPVHMVWTSLHVGKWALFADSEGIVRTRKVITLETHDDGYKLPIFSIDPEEGWVLMGVV